MSPSIPTKIARAFLGRFGGRPRPIQQRAWSRLDDEMDAVITAPTGQGKTEAAFMRIAADLLAGPPGDLRCLVISPTRALAIDLYDRLRDPLDRLGLRADVATSDKNTVGVKTSDVLIRTPEGVDASLCRSAAEFKGLKYVVVDEIHSYSGTPRGTQMAGLLERLSQRSPEARRLGISATVEDPMELVSTKLLRDPIVISEDEDPSTTKVEYFSWRNPSPALRLVRRIRTETINKAIAFAGSKARVEQIKQLIGVGHLSGRCFVHHAGLSPRVRRDQEERFRRAKVGVVVSTSTLEVGIDIGTVDGVILFDAPPDYSAYRQRIGRAGRRNGVRRVLVVTDLFNRRSDFAKVMGISRARRDIRPLCAGVLQQIASYIAEHGQSPIAEIRKFAKAAFGIASAGADVAIDVLIDGGLIDRNHGDFELSAAGQQLLDRRLLHMTFAPPAGATIRDYFGGEIVGVASITEGNSILLGGKVRKLKGIDPSTGHALTVVGSDGSPAFASGRLSAFENLARKYRIRLSGHCTSK